VNYRHHFHAGNFADLVKHAIVTAALARLQQDAAPLLVIDTHAGAGAYALDPASLLEGEAAAAARLARTDDAPPAFARLRQVMEKESARAGTTVYPGSPLLVADALRPRDRLVACELRADDHAALAELLRGTAGAEAVRGDGFRAPATRSPPCCGRSPTRSCCCGPR
jgi:23S rRNA (adenine2030-N6)-methyltransferase